VSYDTWTDFVVHVHWSTSTNGKVELWKNGVKVFSDANTRTLIAKPVYMEFQNYGPAANTTRTNIFDEIRVGSSYAAVAP
jgi:hypothetical protein